MPNYTVALIGPPTSNFTLTSRTYEVLVRICTDGDPCDLFPTAIQNSNISYPNPPPAGDPISALPQTYDLSFYGCPNEVDLGAVLASSSGGPQVEPNDCDYEEMEAIRGEPIPTRDCLCCREYTFTWAAEVVDGNTVADDVANDTCPEVTIDSFVVQRRLEQATFQGFFSPLTTCADTSPIVVEESNIETGDEEGDLAIKNCLSGAFQTYETELNAATNVFEDEVAEARTFGQAVIRNQKIEEAEEKYETARRDAFNKFKAAHETCIENDPDLQVCWPMSSGDRMVPRSPNGSPIDIFQEITEKIITIEHLATSHNPLDYEFYEGTVNTNDYSIVFPCSCFSAEFLPRTLRLNKVDATQDTFNEVKVWRRRYEFHYRKFGWDEYVPMDGVDRAVCAGSPEGTFFKDDEDVCQTGVFAPTDCLDDCENLPAKAAITDVFGNGLRDPIPLTIQGQPDCNALFALTTGWRPYCSTEFADLTIPQMFTPNEIRDTLESPAPGDPPDEVCGEEIDGETRTVYYRDICTVFTWQCDCTGGPCQWVNLDG